jgi:hypothetical protein
MVEQEYDITVEVTRLNVALTNLLTTVVLKSVIPTFRHLRQRRAARGIACDEFIKKGIFISHKILAKYLGMDERGVERQL